MSVEPVGWEKAILPTIFFITTNVWCAKTKQLLTIQGYVFSIYRMWVGAGLKPAPTIFTIRFYSNAPA